VNQQPNSNYCFVCGRDNPRGLYMTFFDNGKDEVWAEHVISDDYQGYPGVVHGGVQSAILDEIICRVSLIEDIHHFMAAAKMDVRFRKPVPTGENLRFVARRDVLRGGRGRATAQILLRDGTVATEATILLVDLPEEIRRRGTDEELGWRVDCLQ